MCDEKSITEKQVDSLIRELDFLELSPSQTKYLEALPLSKIRQERKHSRGKSDFSNITGKVDFLKQEQILLLFREIYHHVSELNKLRNGSVSPEERPSRMKGHETLIREAVDEIFLSHRMLVLKSVNRFRWIGEVFLDDMTQEAAIALFRAIRRYDPTCGIPFLVYARRSIHNGLKDYVDDVLISDNLMLPASGHLTRMGELIREYKRENDGEEPSEEYIAQVTGSTLAIAKKVKLLVKRMHNLQHACVSMDEEGDDGFTLHDVVFNSRDMSVENHVQYQELLPVLDRLSELEKSVIEMHVMQGMTFDDIGKHFHMTRSRMHQLEEKAIRKIRQWLKIKTVNHAKRHRHTDKV